MAINTLQGTFYSTPFRVRDEQAFATDPAILEMQKHMDMFAGDQRFMTYVAADRAGWTRRARGRQ